MKLIEIISLNDDTEYIKLDIKQDIEKLKKIIQKYFGFYPREQLWFKNGNLIKQNKIECIDIDRLHVLINNEWLKIYIKTTTDKIIDLPLFSSKNKIKDIKLMIFSKTKLRPDKFKLIYDNTPLKDDEYLSKYNIRNLSTLYLIIDNNSGFV